jgi:hypothetical protein
MGWSIPKALEMATDKAVIDNIDIYRSAKLLINQHEEEAEIFVAMQADESFEQGDLVSNVSAYGTHHWDCIREDFWHIVVTEGNADETEIADTTDGCRQGDQGCSPRYA